MRYASEDLSLRTKRFALRILKLYSVLPAGGATQILGKQLLRSGTSVGAHVREARHSRTNAEMYSKVSVALQELEETRYWVELLEESQFVRKERLVDLNREMDELKAILFSGMKRIKQRIH